MPIDKNPISPPEDDRANASSGGANCFRAPFRASAMAVKDITGAVRI